MLNWAKLLNFQKLSFPASAVHVPLAHRWLCIIPGHKHILLLQCYIHHTQIYINVNTSERTRNNAQARTMVLISVKLDAMVDFHVWMQPKIQEKWARPLALLAGVAVRYKIWDMRNKLEKGPRAVWVQLKIQGEQARPLHVSGAHLVFLAGWDTLQSARGETWECNWAGRG